MNLCKINIFIIITTIIAALALRGSYHTRKHIGRKADHRVQKTKQRLP